MKEYIKFLFCYENTLLKCVSSNIRLNALTPHPNDVTIPFLENDVIISMTSFPIPNSELSIYRYGHFAKIITQRFCNRQMSYNLGQFVQLTGLRKGPCTCLVRYSIMSSVSEARVRYERHCRSSVASCLRREVRMSCKTEIKLITLFFSPASGRARILNPRI